MSKTSSSNVQFGSCMVCVFALDAAAAVGPTSVWCPWCQAHAAHNRCEIVFGQSGKEKFELICLVLCSALTTLAHIVLKCEAKSRKHLTLPLRKWRKLNDALMVADATKSRK